VRGGWRKLYSKDLYILYSSPNIIRKIESRRQAIYRYRRKEEYSILIGKLEGKGPLGRPRHRWKDSIKIGL
jgi:hypothetical protein